MNSELEDLELAALLQELEKDSNEIDQLCLEMDQFNLEMDELDKLIDEFHCLNSEKRELNTLADKKTLNSKLDSAIRALKLALEATSRHFDRPNTYKRKFFTVIQKFRIILIRFKTIQLLQKLDLNFKYLYDYFQNIRHKNHIVMLQPRLQAINSIEA